MPQAYFIRGAYFILRSNISLVPQGTNFIEKDDCFRNRLFHPGPRYPASSRVAPDIKKNGNPDGVAVFETMTMKYLPCGKCEIMPFGHCEI